MTRKTNCYKQGAQDLVSSIVTHGGYDHIKN